MSLPKILIIRLSSFGDIVQTLPTVDALTQNNYEVHYYTKPEFKYIVEPHPDLKEIYYFNKKNGLLSELSKFRTLIKTNQYNYIYDAHSNTRTLLFRISSFFIRLGMSFDEKGIWIRRSKYRIRRILFFKFKVRSVFKRPLIAAESFLSPLLKVNAFKNLTFKKTLNLKYKETLQNLKTEHPLLLPQNFILLAPSAAWPLKRWPTEYFIELTQLFPQNSFVIIGGPDDQFALKIQGTNVINLIGKLNWAQTGFVISKAQILIAADTGVLHWADYIGVPTVGILGPTAFGTPFRASTTVLNLNLPCSPCTKDGRGKCKIKSTQKCLKDITPNDVYPIIEKVTSI